MYRSLLLLPLALFPSLLPPVTAVGQLISDVPLPPGFKRIPPEKNSFGDWLRGLPLKKDRTVYLFNGKLKTNQSAQYAVIDIPIGSRDLLQCADAVMRLRAGWLFDMGRFHEIRFRDYNGKEYTYAGGRSKAQFNEYMETVFAHCGTASLSKQLVSISLPSRPGDVLIRGGFPGHAVLVADAATNKNGDMIFLLAQGYMPAQDIHLLLNPSDPGISPWYRFPGGTDIVTPEFVFRANEWKRWP